MKFAPEIRLIISDLDGTLTDGAIWIDDCGSEMRRFDVRDGQLINLAKQKGFEFACVTASSSPGIKKRLEKIGFTHVFMGVTNKDICISELASRLGLSKNHILYVGDDVNDLAAFSVVGTKVAVKDACIDLIYHADFITDAVGGHGALREIIEKLLSLKESSH